MYSNCIPTVCVCLCAHVCVCTCMCVCTPASMHVCVCMHACVCMCAVNVYVQACMCLSALNSYTVLSSFQLHLILILPYFIWSSHLIAIMFYNPFNFISSLSSHTSFDPLPTSFDPNDLSTSFVPSLLCTSFHSLLPFCSQCAEPVCKVSMGWWVESNIFAGEPGIAK